ncbi:unnamed protein product [Didymodactylos carnosus]|uniref:V-SNARE coiled-coil homology domain-containing protein n=1 Tax=Didymodactylos carnosus TaxID=1234261 RepID=A0A8S2EIM7_9BILA|nr:unnamed protein product [Didymodactylos carnosus]CAF3994782.1 unnamed protein product [Didymodactylos carnosus]
MASVHYKSPTAIDRLQNDVQEVTVIIKDNLEKVIDRDSALTQLHGRAEELDEHASQFKIHAKQIERKFWWKNVKISSPLIQLRELPKTYHVQGIIQLPYAEINEPFEAWIDSTIGYSRIDYYKVLTENHAFPLA